MTKYYDSRENAFKPIPAARFYVLSEDTFLSGWGYAKGLVNTTVTPCDDMATAERVAAYAKSRGDTRRVRIVCNRPRTRATALYSLVPGWIETSQAWADGPRWEKK